MTNFNFERIVVGGSTRRMNLLESQVIRLKNELAQANKHRAKLLQTMIELDAKRLDAVEQARKYQLRTIGRGRSSKTPNRGINAQHLHTGIVF